MKTPNPRTKLIDYMQQLESKNLSCAGCSGTCCTFEANSMMITPLEAYEILKYLKESNLLNDDLKMEMLKSIHSNRLDQPQGNGRKSFMRRTYTCPFFLRSEFGCPLPREVKPYGCLAFNSNHPTLKASEHCFSKVELLEELEKDYPELKQKNEMIRTNLGLSRNKQPIPVALVELWEKIDLISQILN